MPRTPQETFHELTGRIAALISGKTESAAGGPAALYAERAHVSFPLTPGAGPLRGRDELRAHFTAVAAGFAGVVTDLRTEGVRILETADPEVIVAEFHYVATTPQGAMTLPNAFIMRVRNGEIVESRDYAATPA